MSQMIAKVIASIRHPKLALARIRNNVDFTELMLHEKLRNCGLLDGITTVIDAGAHHGNYARLFSYIMPTAEIICFEPLPHVYKVLQKQTKNNPNISAYCMALGSRTERIPMNVSGIDQASSLFKMTDAHKNLWPESATSKPIDVQVTTLDAFASDHAISGDVFLKADVQGFELELLRGAKTLLRQVRFMRLELSFIPLYEGAPAFSDVCAFLEKTGFRFHSMVGEVKAPTKVFPVQGDFLFVRTDFNA